MSYDLYNPSTGISLTFSRQFLLKALELAELYGWQPRRTQPPAQIDFCALGAEWHGGYLTNDGQTVIASDARWLAAALERSLRGYRRSKSRHRLGLPNAGWMTISPNGFPRRKERSSKRSCRMDAWIFSVSIRSNILQALKKRACAGSSAFAAWEASKYCDLRRRASYFERSVIMPLVTALCFP